MYSRRKKTHVLYCFQWMCHTGCGNGRYRHSKPGSQGSQGGAGFCCTEGWPDDFTAAPRGSSFELGQRGPRAALLPVGWYGQEGHGSSKALLRLPNLSRVPVCVRDAEGTHSALQSLRGQRAWEEPSLQHPQVSLQHRPHMAQCWGLKRTTACQGQTTKTLSGPGTVAHPSHC